MGDYTKIARIMFRGIPKENRFPAVLRKACVNAIQGVVAVRID